MAHAVTKYKSVVVRCALALKSTIGERRKIPGDRYLQHDREKALQAKRNLLAIVREMYSVESCGVLKHSDDEIHPGSYVGRMLNDYGGPLDNAWGRLMCINWDNFREYEQPYYAMNPDKAPAKEMR